MPTVRLIAEGVGPFEKLDLDLSDGHGEPHLGPHILAGVNGSGKSTALRALAWVLDLGRRGFPYQDWQHALAGQTRSRAVVYLKPPHGAPQFQVCSNEILDATSLPRVRGWVLQVLPEYTALVAMRKGRFGPPHQGFRWWLSEGFPDILFSAAYSPSRSLEYLASPDLTKSLGDPEENALAFESTVQNEAIQAWLLGLYSKKAIARERRQSAVAYALSLGRFEKALKLICGEDLRFDVEIEPRLQPRVRMRHRSLNFSQLPDGVRNTVGWLADFMMRQDAVRWDPGLEAKRPGILILDEVDAHLHPRWQRTLLPAMRKALPDVQIIVSSHSPFVISSCPGSRVHVLELDQYGKAHALPPVDAPIGASVTATLKDIFEVDSRFDVETERELDEWNRLKKKEAGRRKRSEELRLRQLTRSLSAKNEELRLIVSTPPRLSRSLFEALSASASKEGRGKDG